MTLTRGKIPSRKTLNKLIIIACADITRKSLGNNSYKLSKLSKKKKILPFVNTERRKKKGELADFSSATDQSCKSILHR